MARQAVEPVLALLLVATLAGPTPARASDRSSLASAGPQAPAAGSDEALRAGMARAQVLLGSERANEAATLLEDLLRSHPGFGPAQLQLGRIRLEAGDAEAARVHLEIAVRTTTRRPFLAWHLLGPRKTPQ